MPRHKGAGAFPANATPQDKHGFPHYQSIGAANARYRDAYLRELAERRSERAKIFGNGTRWRKRAGEVRLELSRSLGLQLTNTAARIAPRALRAFPLFSKNPAPGTPAWAADLKAIWYEIDNACWDGGAIELLTLRSVKIGGPYPAILLIPDCGARLFGAQSAESAAGEWGCALAAAGFLVVIPKLPSLEAYSATQNKRRILEGACAPGEVVGEAAAVLGGVLRLPGVKGKRAWLAGKGLGGLAALFLGGLDSRAAGVIADSPLNVGTGSDPDGLAIPRFNQITDLAEVAAMIAPRPLALIAPNPKAELRADVRTLAHTARKAFAKRRGTLASFAQGQIENLIAWMQHQSKAIQTAPDGKRVIRGPVPQRRYAISKISNRKTWMQWASRLRREYRLIAGMPAESKILSVKPMGSVTLPDCTREEFHIQTGEHHWSNLTFMRPKGERRRRVTILCLPGSGSDVAHVENRYAHEVIAEGWNACIIDARVALYPFHPAIAEGVAVVNQSLHDLCACMDFVCSRDDVDTARIGTMGVSQGGTHSWMLAAMDERIAAAAPVCGVCTYRSLWAEWRTKWYDSALFSFLDSHSMYYFTPGVLHLADQQDLCGLIAPRPFALIGANHDNCFPLSGLRECDRDLRRLYKLMGKPRNYVYHEFNGPHSMPEHTRRFAYAFFRKHLGK